jgi:hypothetical protein
VLRSVSQRVELIRCRQGAIFKVAQLALASNVHGLDAGSDKSGAAKGLESQHGPRFLSFGTGEKSYSLMRTIDAPNQRHGREDVGVAAAGLNLQ